MTATQTTFKNLRDYLMGQWRRDPGTVSLDWVAAVEAALALQAELDEAREAYETEHHNAETIDRWREKAEVEFEARTNDYASECAKLDNERYEAENRAWKYEQALRKIVGCDYRGNEPMEIGIARRALANK